MADLIVRIGATSKEFQAELDRLRKKTEDLQDSFETAAKVSGAAFLGLSGVIGFTTKVYAEAEEAQNKVSQALALQGLNVKDLTEDYKEQANALEGLTGADDAAIMRGMAMMQGQMGQLAITKDLTAAVVDLSAGLGIDLESAFSLVAKTVGTNTNALARNGIEIDTNASKQEKIAAVIEQVNGLYGGQAAASVKGLGSTKLLSAAFEDLQKALGERFAPVVVSVTQGLTRLFNSINQNPALLDLVAKTVMVGAGFTGLVTVLSTAAIGFIKIRAVMLATLPVIAGMTTGVRALVGATGIGLIIVALGAVLANWETVWPKMKGVLVGFITGVWELLKGFGNLLRGVFTNDIGAVVQGVKQLEEAFRKGVSAGADSMQESGKRAIAAQDATNAELLKKQQEFAAKMQSQKDQAEASAKARDDAAAAAKIADLDGASKEMVALMRQEADILKQLEDEKNAAVREGLAKHLEEVRFLKQAQALQDEADLVIYREQALAGNEEYQLLTEAQQEEFRLRNQAQLLAQVQSEDDIRKAAALKRAQDQIAANNTYLANQQKFGTAYAAIFKFMHTEVFKGTQSAIGELTALQQSSNSKLKAIGKAAAVANIAIKTAESAMNIYAGFAALGPWGIPLGIAGAAAAVAFGAEQMRNVVAANTGGIVPGTGPNRDSVFSYLTPGELVVPRQNFDEVVNAVAANRSIGDTGGEVGGMTHVVISLKDELIEFIEAKIVERQHIGVSLLPSGRF